MEKPCHSRKNRSFDKKERSESQCFDKLWNWRNSFGWKATEVTGLSLRFSGVNKVFLYLPHSNSKVHKTPGWLSKGVLLWWQMKCWSHFSQNAMDHDRCNHSHFFRSPNKINSWFDQSIFSNNIQKMLWLIKNNFQGKNITWFFLQMK